MTDGLVRAPALAADALDGRAYLASLLREGVRAGLLAPGEADRVLGEAMEILRGQAERLTMRRSSSLRAEIAQELFDSVLFTAGVALKACPSPEEALDALRTRPLGELFLAGQARIRRKVAAARLWHARLGEELFLSPNRFWRGSAVDGIGGFFAAYRPDFFAQRTIITADYPAYLPLPPLCGIEFIERYLDALFRENRFCRAFSPAAADAALRAYRADYAGIPMNLCGVLFASAAGCVLSRRPARSLSPDAELLARRFTDAPGIAAAFEGALPLLTEELALDARTVAYLARCIPSAAQDAARALALGHPELAFPSR